MRSTGRVRGARAVISLIRNVFSGLLAVSPLTFPLPQGERDGEDRFMLRIRNGEPNGEGRQMADEGKVARTARHLHDVLRNGTKLAPLPPELQREANSNMALRPKQQRRTARSVHAWQWTWPLQPASVRS